MTPEELKSIGAKCVIYLETLLDQKIETWYVTEFLIHTDFVMSIRVTGFTVREENDFSYYDYVFNLQDYASTLMKVTRLIAISKDENIFSCH
jgi:hypothetical protein